MKRKTAIFIILLCIITIFEGSSNVHIVNAKRTYVRGYTRKDGTHVSGYWRNSSSSSRTTNRSTYTPTYSSPTPSPSITYYPKEENNNYTTKSFYGSNSITQNNTINLYRYCDFVGTIDSNTLVYVHGYYKKDGTFVRPHYRTFPNYYLMDNFSTQGISTLLPLNIASYYNYTYNKNEKIKTIETYLLRNIYNHTKKLTNSQKRKTQNYSIKLNKNTTDSTKYGIALYKSFGMSEFEAKTQNKFDQDGIITSELYLCSILNGYGININDKDTFMYKYYLTLLSMYKNSKLDFSYLFNFGLFFYEYYGLSKNMALEQVVMDTNQNNLELGFNNLEENVLRMISTDFISMNQFLSDTYQYSSNYTLNYYIDNYSNTFDCFSSGLKESTRNLIYYYGEILYSFNNDFNFTTTDEKVEADIVMYFIHTSAI